MVSVSLSTRVSPQVRDRLAAEASARGVPLATYTRTLLSGVSPGQGIDTPDGALLNEVECVFYGLPPEAGVFREVCLALARTTAAGGAAGVAAGKELLHLTDVARRRYDPEPDEDEFLRD
jgi:hypothetical protein